MPSSVFESRTRSTPSSRSTSRQRSAWKLRPADSRQDKRQEGNARLLIRKRGLDAGYLGRLENRPGAAGKTRTLGEQDGVCLDELLPNRRVEYVHEHVHVQIEGRGRVLGLSAQETTTREDALECWQPRTS